MELFRFLVQVSYIVHSGFICRYFSLYVLYVCLLSGYSICVHIFGHGLPWHSGQPFKMINLIQIEFTYITFSFFYSSFFTPALETAKCEFSASRRDWWACAMRTSRRSINVSLMPARVPNASLQLQTMSENKNGPDCQYYIKTST